jgi:hypothetical protein
MVYGREMEGVHILLYQKSSYVVQARACVS